jgi:hypothetical protein
VLERSASCLLLSTTSVILLDANGAFSLCGAALRYRPNGDHVLCPMCHQSVAYRKLVGNGCAVLFKCRAVEHPSDVSRHQTVHLLQSDDTRTVVGGVNARCRYIITRSVYLLSPSHHVSPDAATDCHWKSNTCRSTIRISMCKLLTD